MSRIRLHPAYIEDLARRLVAVPSVVNTPGEASIAERLHALLTRLPYFRAHPERLRLIPVPGSHARAAVLAWIKGSDSRDAVVLLGHIDTVGVDDYGELAELATDPDRLRAALGERADGLPEDAARDLQSPDWLWGRGAVDMKSGVAVHLAICEAYAADPASLRGHLVLLLTPDEEDGSAGAIAALPALAGLAEREGLRYVAVINADFTGPLHPGDPNRYAYLGSAGKLLPAFYVRGEEAHASEPFAGVDPNILAGALTRRISFNTDLADRCDRPEYPDGEVPDQEWLPPPVALKQADLKRAYDVQTPGEAAVWFNLLTAGSTPDAATRRLREAAAFAVRDAVHLVVARRHRFSRLAGRPFDPSVRQPAVQTFADLVEEVRQARGDAALRAWREEVRRLDEADLRAWSLEAVRRLVRLAPGGRPRVVLYYGSGFVPRTVVDPATPAGARLARAVIAAVREIGRRFPDQPIQVRRYYPYISDLSLLCPGPDDPLGADLAAQFPSWGVRYRLDRDLVLRLGAPGVNLGPYGKDAHKPTERVHRGYTFTVLPQLIDLVIRQLLGARG